MTSWVVRDYFRLLYLISRAEGSKIELFIEKLSLFCKRRVCKNNNRFGHHFFLSKTFIEPKSIFGPKISYSCKNNNCWFILYDSTRHVCLYHINQHLDWMRIYNSTILCTLGAVWLNYMISFIVGKHIYLLDYRYV